MLKWTFFLGKLLSNGHLRIFSHLLTVIYIFKSFEIKTHVFALIFIYSLISFLGSGISIVFDALLFAGHLQTICKVAFITAFLPGSYGAVLTFRITSIRFYLANQAAKNIHPSNKKVLTNAMSFFVLIAACYMAFFVICTTMNICYSLFIDLCMTPTQEPRTLSNLTMAVLHSPNYFNIFSLITDLRMLRFLRQTILPTDTIPLQLRITSHEGNDWFLL